MNYRNDGIFGKKMAQIIKINIDMSSDVCYPLEKFMKRIMN